jgi:hypothetical protein
MARLTPLPMVETGLLSFSNCLFRAMRRIPPAYCRRSASVPSHPIKENLPGSSFCALQVLISHEVGFIRARSPVPTRARVRLLRMRLRSRLRATRSDCSLFVDQGGAPFLHPLATLHAARRFACSRSHHRGSAPNS